MALAWVPVSGCSKRLCQLIQCWPTRDEGWVAGNRSEGAPRDHFFDLMDKLYSQDVNYDINTWRSETALLPDLDGFHTVSEFKPGQTTGSWQHFADLDPPSLRWSGIYIILVAVELLKIHIFPTDPALRPRRPVTFVGAADRFPYVLIGWKLPHTVLHYWWRQCQFGTIISPLEPSTNAYSVAHLPLVSRQPRSTYRLMTNPFVAADMIPGTKQVTVEVTLRSGLLSKRGKAFLRRRKHGLTFHGQASRAQLHVWARLRSYAFLLHFLKLEGRGGSGSWQNQEAQPLFWESKKMLQ